MKFFASIVATGILVSPGAFAAEMPPASMERPLQAPSVPKAMRERVLPAEATRGPVLRAQVEKKLRAGFDAAAAEHGGVLTREQASAAGLGFIAQHFDAIDVRKTGAVRFEDVKVFMRRRGAELD